MTHELYKNEPQIVEKVCESCLVEPVLCDQLVNETSFAVLNNDMNLVVSNDNCVNMDNSEVHCLQLGYAVGTSSHEQVVVPRAMEAVVEPATVVDSASSRNARKPVREPISVTAPMTLCYEQWNRYLESDVNREFLLSGIADGFKIFDDGVEPGKFCQRNYRSATESNLLASEKQIQTELDLGRYVIAEIQPLCVSSIGAIPKTNNRVRLIHDMSRPNGGVNSYVTDTSVSFSTIDTATKLMSPNCFIAKIDLASAYRSVPVHASCFNMTGLSWIFSDTNEKVYMYDVRLPFGAAKSCKVFQSVSDAVVRIMQRNGYVCTSYIDDFLVIGDTESLCKEALDFLLKLVVDLGLEVNWAKVEQPETVMTFLGVEINTVKRTLALPEKKLQEVRVLLFNWSFRKSATKKDLQKLVGKLNWCARVVTGGRTFLRNIINCMCKVKQTNHHVRLSASARSDLAWWCKALDLFHGYTGFTCDNTVPSFEFSTDSCLKGAGGHFKNKWFYISWEEDLPEFASSHINVLELKTVEIAAELWAPLWGGKHIRVYSDNSATVACVNKGTSRSPELLNIIQKLFWMSVKYNFRLTAAFIPGKQNILSDRLSRLDEPLCAQEAWYLLSGNETVVLECSGSMTYSAFLRLQGCWGIL